MKVRNYGEINIFKNSQIDIFNDKIRRHFTTAVTALALLLTNLEAIASTSMKVTSSLFIRFL